MSTLHIIKHFVVTTQTKLARMKSLKQAIEELEAEYDMLKKEIIASHFEANNTDVFTNDKGLVLATYKPQLRTLFKTTDFKKNEPDLYEKYLDIKEIKTFIIK